MRFALALAFLLFPVVVSAAPQKSARPAAPAAKDTRPVIEKLFSQLAKAETPDEAKPIEQKIAGHFRASGSAAVDLLMARAHAVVASDKKVARKLIESVTRIAPDFAEGWRARAAIENEAGDDGAAMVSLQKAVALNPRHFFALTELGVMLEEYGDNPGALKLYRQALALDPQLELATRKVRELTQSVEGRDI